jgi:proton-translocating NADH-quinone oxidoreductase chain N
METVEGHAPAPDPATTPPAPSEAPQPALRARKKSPYGTALFVGVLLFLGAAYYFGWLDGFSAVLLPDLAWQSMTPELVVLLFALLAPMVGLWDTDRRGMQQFAFIGLAGGFLLTLGSLVGWDFPIPGTGIRFTLEYIGSDLKGVFAVTYASQFLKLIFLGVAMLAVLGVGRPFKGKVEQDWGEFYSLLLFATLGMMVVASAQDLIVLFLGIEMASMSSYLLASFRRDKVGAEAGLKYFTIGAVSSGMTLFAISLLYGMAGSTSIPDLGDRIVQGGSFDAVSVLPIVLLLAGLGFKVSSVPFHAWAPDVYAGSPVPVAGMLAAASKAMGFAAIFQVFLVGLTGVSANWELAVAVLAAASMFFGNLVAIQQDNVRRMLAYSSIAQAGYILIAVAVVGAVGGADADTVDEQRSAAFALGGGLFHLLVNAAMKLGAFLIVGALLFVGIPDQVDAYKGLGKRAPFLAIAMAVFLFSMAGLPPLGGFASKFVLFSGAIDVSVTQDLGWLAWLAVIAVVNSAISLYYYLRIVRAMYVEQGEPGEKVEVDTGATVAVAVCLAGVLVMGIYPQWFIDASVQAARSMLRLG